MRLTVRMGLALVAAALAVAVLLGWEDPNDVDRILAVGVFLVAVGLVAP